MDRNAAAPSGMTPTGAMCPAAGPGTDAFEIRCSDLALSPGGLPVLEGVDLHLPPGSISTVLGASGSGTTTLVNAMLGLEPVRRGTIRIGPFQLPAASPQQLAHLRRRVSVLPDFRLGAANVGLAAVTVRQVLLAHLFHRHAVVEPLEPRSWAAGAARAETFPRLVERAEVWLDRLDLLDLAGSLLTELSPVDLRRFSIALALSVDAPLYLLDDPDIALDEAHRDAVVEALLDTHRRTAATMVLVTNDLAVMTRVSDRVVVLAGGRMVFEGAPEGALGDLRYLRPVAEPVPDDGLVVVDDLVADGPSSGIAAGSAPAGAAHDDGSPALTRVSSFGIPDDLAVATDQVGGPGYRRRKAARSVLDVAFTAVVFALIIAAFLLVVARGG